MAAGTLVISRATAGAAADDEAPAERGDCVSVATTIATTSTSTTAILPPAIRTLRRVSARWAAARCKAIFCLAFCALIVADLALHLLFGPGMFQLLDPGAEQKGVTYFLRT